MKIFIADWAPVRDKLPRATALYRTANDPASSDSEKITANKQLVSIARSIGWKVDKLRSAILQSLEQQEKPKQKGVKPTPEPKKRPAWAHQPWSSRTSTTALTALRSALRDATPTSICAARSSSRSTMGNTRLCVRSTLNTRDQEHRSSHDDPRKGPAGPRAHLPTPCS